MTFNTDTFRRSHGRQPRGFGAWVFASVADVDMRTAEQGRDWQTFTGSFGDARRQAAAWARAQGHRTVWVQP